MSYGYGSSSDYHTHGEYADRRDLQSVEDQVRDLRVDLSRADDRIEQVRQDVLDYVRVEISGLSDWIREQAEHAHAPVPAKDGGA